MGEKELVLPLLFIFLLSLKGLFNFSKMSLSKSGEKKALNLSTHSFKRVPHRQRSWEDLLARGRARAL